MRIECPKCLVRYEVADSAIPAGGRSVQCGACGHVWMYRRPDPVALPPRAPAERVLPPGEEPDFAAVEDLEAGPAPAPAVRGMRPPEPAEPGPAAPGAGPAPRAPAADAAETPPLPPGPALPAAAPAEATEAGPAPGMPGRRGAPGAPGGPGEGGRTIAELIAGEFRPEPAPVRPAGSARRPAPGPDLPEIEFEAPLAAAPEPVPAARPFERRAGPARLPPLPGGEGEDLFEPVPEDIARALAEAEAAPMPAARIDPAPGRREPPRGPEPEPFAAPRPETFPAPAPEPPPPPIAAPAASATAALAGRRPGFAAGFAAALGLLVLLLAAYVLRADIGAALPEAAEPLAAYGEAVDGLRRALEAAWQGVRAAVAAEL